MRPFPGWEHSRQRSEVGKQKAQQKHESHVLEEGAAHRPWGRGHNGVVDALWTSVEINLLGSPGRFLTYSAG